MKMGEHEIWQVGGPKDVDNNVKLWREPTAIHGLWSVLYLA